MQSDDEYLKSLVKEYGISKRKSPIRRIANEIYKFLDQYQIELNPMERERLSLYLVHYKNSKKAAAHIYPIHPGLKRIPKCKKKIAKIIDDVSDKVADNELQKQNQSIDEELTQALDEKPVFEQKDSIEIKTHRKKLSKIKSFNENNDE
ncbi:MAG: hypothetical protein KGY50_05065 [Candidatus Thermoplasmatota archaeon]|nr:hypothetical protein [Candidatus Thermoplasmatota archaeon]